MSRIFEIKQEGPFISLRSKLLLFFIAFFCLMVLTAAYIALAHRGTAELMDNMLAENEKLETAAEEINLLHYHTTNYLNSRNREDYQLYRETVQKLQRLYTGEEVETVAEFSPLIAGFIEKSEQLVERAEREENYQIQYEKFTERSDILISYLNQAINANNRQANSIYADSWNLINQMERYGITMALFLGLFSLLFLYLFSENITRPLDKIIDRSQKLAEGDFSLPPVEVETRDELNHIARAYNMMTAELEALFTELQEKLEVERQLQQKQVENLKMKNLLKEAELKKLQSQINPHFLFNTLNSISQLAVIEDADRTGEMITKVAEHFRRNLKRSEELITVEEELQSVHLYCDILKTRFGENIQFNFIYEDKILQQEIPPLTIQPLVENAFLHGIKKSGSSSGLIEVELSQQKEWLKIKVQDDGSGMDKELVGKILQEEEPGGLSNIKERLRLFYQRDDLLEIEGIPGRGTKVTIYIPRDFSSEEDN